MGLFDTHTHLDSFHRSGALPGILERAKAAGVDSMVSIGTSPDDWALYRQLAADHAGTVYYTAGIHPCEVTAEWESAFAQLAPFWNSTSVTSPRPVAVGEIGLDRFHLPKDPAEAEAVFARQCAAFSAQLMLAKELKCPIVIHSRGAFRECVEMIDASGVDWTGAVFHCFAENEAEIAQLNERGAVGSFTGILTYKSAENVRIAAKRQGLARFMVETDAPYLTPVPHRGKPNEPAFVKHTAEFAASEVFRVNAEELAAISTANARRFYRLS